jgi:hypothetical protein
MMVSTADIEDDKDVRRGVAEHGWEAESGGANLPDVAGKPFRDGLCELLVASGGTRRDGIGGRCRGRFLGGFGEGREHGGGLLFLGLSV